MSASPYMLNLYAVLAARRDAVIAKWRSIVEGTIAPESISTIELVDHLPNFLDEVIAALRSNDGPSAPARGVEDSATAADHGEQRLRLGFSLDAVVREYGALRDAFVAVALEAGVTIAPAEAQQIFDSTIGGIAQAVSEYSRQRDAELQRHHNEHVAFIAHELRNPLSSSMSAFELLERKGHLPPELHAVGALSRGLHQILELIDHSLNVARVATGIELHRESTPVRLLLDEAVHAALGEAEDKGVTIQADDGAEARLYVDRRLLRSALGNLVRNAVKFSKTGGAIAVRTRIERDRVVIEVEDCCGGLPPGGIEAAFAPFERLGSDQPGFGLGLAIAKQAIDAHNGSIRVHDLPGRGCIFSVELPVVLS